MNVRKPIDLDALTITEGQHARRADGTCVMEAAAWLAGHAHTDAPPCVSPVIRAFLIKWNDNLPSDKDRNRLLKPLLSVILDTRSTPEIETRRSFMALDWFIREHVPAWFDLTPSLKPSGDALRAAAEIVDLETARAIAPLVQVAKKEAVAAWDAARGHSVGRSVGVAAWDAVTATAWVAARDVAWDAAWVVAWGTAWDAAWDTAWVAVKVAAWDAAWVVARDTARDAAWVALEPITERLQVSAQNLVRRMCELKP